MSTNSVWSCIFMIGSLLVGGGCAVLWSVGLSILLIPILSEVGVLDVVALVVVHLVGSVAGGLAIGWIAAAAFHGLAQLCGIH